MPFLVPTQVVTALSAALGTAVGFPPLQGGAVAAAIWPLISNLLGLNSGGVPVTYTRTGSLATFEDFEDILRKLPANDAPPFVGSRLVVNMVPNTEISAANGWTIGSGIDVVTTGLPDAVGGNTATKLSRSVGSSAAEFNKVISFSGEKLTTSIYIYITAANLARAGALIEATDGSVTVVNYVDVTSDLVADQWNRICPATDVTEAVNAVVDVRFRETDDSLGLMELIVCCPQLEDVTGRSNVNPSNFIDDTPGYANYPILHNNTVTNHIVSEAAGADISVSVLKGVSVEKAGTNYFLNSDAPVTQDIDITAPGTGDYTISVYGAGTITSSDNTATCTGHGVASAGTDITFNCSVVGTVTFTLASGDATTKVQVEKNSYSTSYIPTVGSSVNRAVAKATLPANRLPLSNLTLYMEIDWKAKLRDVEHRFLDHVHATLSSWMQFDIAANNKFLFAWKNDGFASANATSTTLSPTSDGVLKIAVTQSVDDGIRFYINGSLEAAMTLTTAAAKAELNTIGAELLYIGSSKTPNKHCDTPIKDFRIYPRVLDQADAEALTTL